MRGRAESEVVVVEEARQFRARGLAGKVVMLFGALGVWDLGSWGNDVVVTWDRAATKNLKKKRWAGWQGLG